MKQEIKKKKDKKKIQIDTYGLNFVVHMIICTLMAILLCYLTYSIYAVFNKHLDTCMDILKSDKTTPIVSPFKEKNGVVDGKLYLIEKYYKYSPNETYIEGYLKDTEDSKRYLFKYNLNKVTINYANQDNPTIQIHKNEHIIITLPNKTNLSKYIENFDEWQTSRRNIRNFILGHDYEHLKKTNTNGILIDKLNIKTVPNKHYDDENDLLSFGEINCKKFVNLEGKFKTPEGKEFTVDNLLDNYRIKYDNIKEPKLDVYVMKNSDMIFDITLPNGTQLSDWIENIDSLIY